MFGQWVNKFQNDMTPALLVYTNSQNDASTRSMVEAELDLYLGNEQASAVIYDYAIVCDNTNNVDGSSQIQADVAVSFAQGGQMHHVPIVLHLTSSPQFSSTGNYTYSFPIPGASSIAATTQPTFTGSFSFAYPSNPRAISFTDGAKDILSISSDGEVTLGEGIDPQYAAHSFYAELKQVGDEWKEFMEWKDQQPKPEAPIDPIEAYNRAMKVI